MSVLNLFYVCHWLTVFLFKPQNYLMSNRNIGLLPCGWVNVRCFGFLAKAKVMYAMGDVVYVGAYFTVCVCVQYVTVCVCMWFPTVVCKQWLLQEHCTGWMNFIHECGGWTSYMNVDPKWWFTSLFLWRSVCCEINIAQILKAL